MPIETVVVVACILAAFVGFADAFRGPHPTSAIPPRAPPSRLANDIFPNAASLDADQTIAAYAARQGHAALRL